MPDFSLSDALAEAYASAPAQEVILHTLEIRHPSFITPIRVVRDHRDLTARLEASAPVDPGGEVTFIGFAFDFVLPELGKSKSPEIEIVLDGASGEIVSYLDAAARLWRQARTDEAHWDAQVADTLSSLPSPAQGEALLTALAAGGDESVTVFDQARRAQGDQVRGAGTHPDCIEMSRLRLHTDSRAVFRRSRKRRRTKARSPRAGPQVKSGTARRERRLSGSSPRMSEAT